MDLDVPHTFEPAEIALLLAGNESPYSVLSSSLSTQSPFAYANLQEWELNGR
jgi:hypothetical protein